MHKNRKPQSSQLKFLRSLVATAFIASGFFPFAPALSGSTTISNTATAEYDNPDGGPKIPATSNTVIVQVDEIVGISLTAQTPEDTTPATPIQVGDLLIYKFTITNTGNDPTTFRIPNTAKVSGPGTLSGTLPGGTANNLQYSTDGGTTWVNLSGTEVFTPSIAPNGTVLVRVPVTVSAGALPSANIDVTLGDTTNNSPTNTQNQQNLLLQSTSPITNDVYTKDNPDGVLGEAPGIMALTQEKEAATTGTAQVGAKNYALATLKKTGAVTTNTDPATITDDKVTYALSLKVENSDVTGNNFTHSALQGTSISLNTGTETRILISDAIPKDTVLDAVPIAPANWEVVYSTQDPNTIDAKAATWTRFSGTTVPAGVRRIGFINTNAITSIPADGSILSGFSVTVKVDGTPTAPLKIANIAQLFGSTVGNNAPVYEESGDKTPSNFNDPVGGIMSPPATTDTNNDGLPDQFPTTIDSGYVPDPNNINQGTETIPNGNDGSGPGGEANLITLNTSNLLNGPNGQPGAVGPTNNNDDFTNKSSTVPTGTAPGTLIDPSPVTFINTVENGSSIASDITLLPTPPSSPGTLPDNTTVTITYAGNTATYTYNQASGTFTRTSGTADVVINGLAANTTGNYTVVVDLPTNTQLSTDPGFEQGYPVPITAFIDSGDSGLDVNDAQNITIDRVYTGFLQLVKYSRILDANGNALTGARAGQSDFATTPGIGVPGDDVPRTPLAGEIIEYQIRYKNISIDPGSGSNNVILNVSGLKITEDGTGPNGNWALDQNSNGIIDTSNVLGSAVDSVPGDVDITYYNSAGTSIGDSSSTLPTTDVTKYVNTLKTTVQIAPGVQRTFTFQRKVN